MLLVYPYSYFGSVEMLSSLGPPSVLQYPGPSIGIDFLPIARLPAEPQPASETYVFVTDILSVGVVS
jgi:hypothetical protein